MNILVGCEESQAVCKAFREKGHTAWSCDVIEESGGHPEWHIQGDVLPLLNGNCNFTTNDGVEHTQIGKWDMIIAFPPCFVAGSKVMTYDGIKNIEDIQVGDLVLTHKGRFKKVLDVMQHQANNMCTIKANNAGTITCTTNHPFYTATINSGRDILDISWKTPLEFYKNRNNYGDIKEQIYLTNVTDDIYEDYIYPGYYKKFGTFATKLVKTLEVDSTEFWYMIGRWVGDGWFYKKSGKRYGICICCAFEETDELCNHLNNLHYNFCLTHQKTTNRFEIYSIELANFIFENFGSGADKKRIPGFVTRLPQEKANSFLLGYLDADGSHLKSGRISFSSISEDLVYGIKYMINKYHHVICGITFNDNTHRQIIQGRAVNAKNSFTGTFNYDKPKQSRYINYNEKYLLSEYTEITSYNKDTTVYNLSVEDDESYTVNGLVVHNCTHLSVSGARHFAKKREDGRQREAIEFFGKILNADCDKIVVENPVNIISGDYIKKWFPDLCKEYGFPKKCTQKIQPYEYGHPYTKTTCLWEKGVPILKSTNVLVQPEGGWKNQSFTPDGRYGGFNGSFNDPKIRSKTFPGVAAAMAEQWG